MAEPPASSTARCSAQEGRTGAPPCRASHLAILRRVLHGRTQLADTRQRAGGTACHCPSSLANEPGFPFQCPAGCLRIRISYDSRVYPVDAADPGYHVEAAKVWRPSAQLV